MNLEVNITKTYADYDILVAGGGLAGFAAALSAARFGSKVILVEKEGYLGGLGVIGATALHNFFNIFDATPGAQRIRVAAGIAQELVDNIYEKGGALGHVHLEKGGAYISMVTPVEPETTKCVLNEMLIENGVEILFHTTIINVDSKNGTINNVLAWNKSGYCLINAKVYIDCTGDGDLSAFAKVPFKHFKANETGAYPAGFTFRLCNVDLSRMERDLENKKLIAMLGHAVKPGSNELDLVRIGFNIRKLRVRGLHYFYASSLRPNELTYCNCLNFGPNDGLDAEALTQGEIFIRKKMLEVVRAFQEKIDGCQQCHAAGASPYVGQRRARSIHCEYELTRDDCITGRQFVDQIGCFSFIDLGTTIVKDSGSFGIPYRALIPVKSENLFIAGRTMSPDNIAFAATRNTVCCLITGQAAGTAAAISVLENITPREVDIKQLQDNLIQNNVLLKPKPDPLERVLE